jgi:hypothetical protein
LGVCLWCRCFRHVHVTGARSMIIKHEIGLDGNRYITEKTQSQMATWCHDLLRSQDAVVFPSYTCKPRFGFTHLQKRYFRVYGLTNMGNKNDSTSKIRIFGKKDHLHE